MNYKLLLGFVGILTCTVAQARTSRVPSDQLECQSIIEAIPDQPEGVAKKTVYKGFYFRKNERTVGFLDELPGYSAFLVRGVSIDGGKLSPELATLIVQRTGVVVTWNTRQPLEVEFDNYDLGTQSYRTKLAGKLDFQGIRIFCAQSTKEIEAMIRRAYPESVASILPFSSGPWEIPADPEL
ncbi:MAG: hypothetical protein NDJ89_06320 [Oligoflexia bacterium]|nr:hypothetical protein [Oligoflexia bacterium]